MWFNFSFAKMQNKQTKNAKWSAPYWLLEHYKANMKGVTHTIILYYTWARGKLKTWTQLTQCIWDWDIM